MVDSSTVGLAAARGDDTPAVGEVLIPEGSVLDEDGMALEVETEVDDLGDEDEEEALSRLKMSAGAAWLLNLVLVIWLAWLFRNKSSTQEPASAIDFAETERIFSLLSKQLADESRTFRSDLRLKEELKEQAAAMASIARRMEAVKSRGACVGASYQSAATCPADLCVWQASSGADPEQGTCTDAKDAQAPWAPILKELREQVSSEQSILAVREAELASNLQKTQTSLADVTKRIRLETQRLDNNAVLGPLSGLSSGVLASMDLGLAVESLSMALLISLATRQWSQAREATAKDATAKEATAKEATASQTVLRFYGRWDDQDEWILLKTLPLEGAAAKVVGAVRSSRTLLGSVSDYIVTALVTRSARGVVQRRGWRSFVEQTQREVGRNFVLGYLVESAADPAENFIPRDCRDRQVQVVPSASILEDK